MPTAMHSSKADSPYGADQLSPIARPQTDGSGVASKPGAPSWVLKPIPVNTRDIVAELNGIIDAKSPALTRWLYSTWNAQESVVKYQEIRNAIRDGEIPQSWVEDWQESYAEFINDRLAPSWEAGMTVGANRMVRGLDGLGIEHDFQLLGGRLRDFVEQRAGELVVDLSTAQRRALNSVLRQHLVGDPLSSTSLSQLLRPLIGLTEAEASWVDKRFAAMREAGFTLKQAIQQSENFAGYLRRVRANRIARTEMAFAYNYGAFHAVEDAVEAGAFPSGDVVVKTWYAQEDERTCPFCGALHEKSVEMPETFPGVTPALPNVFVAPAHPYCRCVILYSVRESGS